MREHRNSKFSILGVDICDVTIEQAISVLEDLIVSRRERAFSIYFANAHTLNIVSADPKYRKVLQRGDYIFADGTGLQWAVRMLYGIQLSDNVNGTDLIPQLFNRLAGKGYRYYMLGATEDVINRSVANVGRAFAGWCLAGHHHGYIDIDQSDELVSQINESRADVLLVGMGNPKQELWIDTHLSDLRVPLCIGVGGLFNYWAKDLKRAPLWTRRIGFEWLYLLTKQPYKFRRYVFGNPMFVIRVVRQKLAGKSHS